MCGIIGYIGKKDAKEILLSSLETLEYRGYDSAGIAIVREDGTGVETRKCAGRVARLREVVSAQDIHGFCGIGHTRWATHGGVCDANAHPHTYGKVTLIHNGIIENYQDLKNTYHLEETLQSETDSEVVAAVLSQKYEQNPNPKEIITQVVKELKGTFALAMLFADQPGKIFAIRNVSPIVVASNEEEAFLASDVTALSQFVKTFFVLPEYQLVELSEGKITLYDRKGVETEPEYLKLDWDMGSNQKEGYAFFMEKEIMEQPKVVAETMRNRVSEGLPDFTGDQIPDDLLKQFSRICILGCGTAMHAGLVAKQLMQSILRVQVDVEVASEFMYNDPVLDRETLVIAISQSGETIDTLEALKYARERSAGVLSIVNVKGSSIARESNYVFYTNAGPEMAVASTKAYITQLTALYLLTCRMAYLRDRFSKEQAMEFMNELDKVPESLQQLLAKKDEIHKIADSILTAKDLFMIGRGLDHAILLEGSLKLKEISYIHSEAYASGELKHGTIALITKETPVIAMVTQQNLQSKELSNAIEVKSRGAEVTLFIKDGFHLEHEDQWKTIFRLPALQEQFMVFPAVVALQLMAFYVSSDKGLDVDKPRNLAKVVTVE